MTIPVYTNLVNGIIYCFLVLKKPLVIYLLYNGITKVILNAIP